jgi:hypothetical protein
MNRHDHPADYLRSVSRTPSVHRIEVGGWCVDPITRGRISFDGQFTPDEILYGSILIPKVLDADVLIYGRLPPGRWASIGTIIGEIDSERRLNGLDPLDPEFTCSDFRQGDAFEYVLRSRIGNND